METVKSEYCVTFFEQVMLLKVRMRELTSGQHLSDPRGYNTEPFMKEILRIVFHTPTNTDGREDYDLTAAERMLIKDGLHYAAVGPLCKLIMEGCVDQLVACIPTLTYDPLQQISYKFINQFDVIIEVIDQLDEVEDAYRGA